MGEYAKYHGQRIKIGTCEDMLYLRWDQRGLVTESETPLYDPEVLAVVRFRFPFPAEDGIEPGAFDDPFRGLRLDDYEHPKNLEHGMVQFTASNGYLVSLPCPESAAIVTMGSDHKPATIHRNGYGGPAALVAQAWRGGRLVGIARCNGCRHMYRLEDGYQDAAAVSIRSAADRVIRTGRADCAEGDGRRARQLHETADRLLAGYHVQVWE